MNIAIIGGGVTGLTAAYLLRRAHDIQLFERNGYAGGHANTVVVLDEHERDMPLDVGFIVYNERTYPGFSRLLRELEVPSQQSEMSFSLRCEEDGYEFSSRGIRGFLAQPRNLLRPSHTWMLLELLRFHRDARRALRRDEMHDISFGEYLDSRHFSRTFRERLMVPLLSSTWSNAPSHIMGFPAHYLFRFLEQHGILAPNSIPDWRWVVGGSKTYVQRILDRLPAGTAHLGAGVQSVCRGDGGVTVTLANGEARRFDAALLACHADEALRLLEDPTSEEEAALSGFRYEPNHVVLHTDERLLPRSKHARAAWNYHAVTRGCTDMRTLTMTYDLNRLQGLKGATTYCVSTNPEARVDPQRVLAEFTYRHPVYSAATLDAQRRLEALNDAALADGATNTLFAGAYLGYGFHEDGLQAGVRVARRLGVEW